MGKIILWTGLALVVVGLILTYMPGMFKWFGKLPGDIRIESENGYIFIPITSMILISLVLTLVVNIFMKK